LFTITSESAGAEVEEEAAAEVDAMVVKTEARRKILAFRGPFSQNFCIRGKMNLD
jgi:hypothetical protein